MWPPEATAHFVQAPPAALDEGVLRAQPQPGRQGPQGTGAENWTHETRPSGTFQARAGTIFQRGRSWSKIKLDKCSLPLL